MQSTSCSNKYTIGLKVCIINISCSYWCFLFTRFHKVIVKRAFAKLPRLFLDHCSSGGTISILYLQLLSNSSILVTASIIIVLHCTLQLLSILWPNSNSYVHKEGPELEGRFMSKL